MKTILKPVEPPKDEEVNVTCSSDGGLVHLHMFSRRRSRDRSFDPAQAVKLWRCLTGKCCTATPDDIHGDTMKLWSHVDPNRGSLWELYDASGERLFCLDADQAMALAWAIVKCCTVALSTSTPDSERPCDKEPKPLCVWVLASKRLLAVCCAENGAKKRGGAKKIVGTEQLGGTERVFLTERAARGALREFLRPIVYESHWEELQGPGGPRSIDDILDDIIDDHCTDDAPNGYCWSYDGPTQSFAVTLSMVEVEQS